MALTAVTSAAADANWKIAPWLQKLGESGSHKSQTATIIGAVAQSLLATQPSPGSCDQLAFARSLRQAGKDEVRRLLAEGGALDAIAEVIYNGLERAALMNNEKADLVRVRKLDDRNWRVRKAATLELSQDARALQTHKAAIARGLEDSEWEVRFAASLALGRLPAAQLSAVNLAPADLEAARTAAIEKLVDPDVYVRIAAVHALSLLEPDDLAGHADAIVANLRATDEPTFAIATAKAAADRDLASPLSISSSHRRGGGTVSPSALSTSAASTSTSAFTPSPLARSPGSRRFEVAKERILHAQPSEEWAARAAAQEARAARLAVYHGSAIVQKLASSYKAHTSFRATQLEPLALSRHGAAAVQNLEDPSQWVRKEAAKLLTRITDPSALGRHAPTLVADLQHREPECRRAAAEVLSKLGPDVLTPHAAVLAGRLLSEGDPDTRMWLVRALGRLPPKQLAEYGPTLVKKLLGDRDHDVRISSAQALLHLDAKPLLRYLSALEIAAVNDPHAAVRDEAAKCLKKIAAEAPPERGARRGTGTSSIGPYTPLTRSATSLPKLRRGDSQTASATGAL